MSEGNDAKRKILEALESALARSPFYDEKSRAEALLEFQKTIDGPPLDDVTKFMTQERAEFVRKLRIDEQCTFRAIAAACSKEWAANWGSNQLIGEDLCRAAAETLRIPLDRFWDIASGD